MVKHLTFLILLMGVVVNQMDAQVVINEYLSSNISGLTDDDNDYSDWIELFNTSDKPVNIANYKISDSSTDTIGWIFPDITIPAHSFLVLFASGKDKDGVSTKYHTIIRRGDSWKYLVPEVSIDGNWRESDFSDVLWSTGPGGFGYGDDDDATVLNNCSVVLIRKEFTIDDVSTITNLLLHVDYDDGFIAFINGEMVTMGSIAEYSDDYSVIQAAGHEAVMYSGGTPEQFDISSAIPLLKNGKNVIAIQGHNSGTGSTDFSLIPYLTVGSNSFSVNDAEDFISVEDGSLHANFKLAKEGETIFLYNNYAVLIDSSKAVALDNDISYGRFPDGASQWSYFDQSTPGTTNSNPLDSITPDSVYFSHESGFYTNSFHLSLSSSSLGNGEIRYSVGGYTPTKSSGLYTEPFEISSTSVVRAAWFGEDGKINPVSTHTFIFEEAIKLPVVSLAMDPHDLWDWDEGIYVLGPNAEPGNPYFGANFWQDWERPVHFEFFDQQQSLKINQDAGLKISGNYSRANDQKSMALFARKSYGNGSFNYKFFNDRKNNSFESVLLRNSGNDWSYTMFRDGLISEIARDMDMERLAYQPSKIYLNGQYWGILNLREKPSEHYFEENFSVDEENLNLLENSGEIIYGKATDYAKLRNFINSKSLDEEENYRQVAEQLDISCFIDYQILEIYVDNGDWPGNNIKFWKTNDPTSKWRWLIFDADFGFDLYYSKGNTLQFATATNGSDWPNPPWSTLFLRKLLTNQEFKNTFINRFSDCLNSNLAAENLLPKVDSIQNLLTPEIENHLTRWGFSFDNWLYEVDRIETYISNRKDRMFSYMRTFFGFNDDKLITLAVSDQHAGRIEINSIIPNQYPFAGNYFSEVPITLKAIPTIGYRFVRWEGGSTSTDLSITINLTSNTTFTAVFEPASQNESSVVINEINYKSPDELDAGDWIEIYNNSSQTVDLSGWLLQDIDPESRFVFPYGIQLYPDEYLVIAEESSKFNKIFPTIKNVTGDFSFGLNSSGDVVSLNDYEGNVIDKVSFGVKAPWPIDPCGLGPTLELLKPDSDNEQASSWSAGQTGGTPGRKNSVYVSTETYTYRDLKASCFPTIFKDYTTLHFSTEKGGKYSVQVLDLQGRSYDKIEGNTTNGSTVSFDLFTNADRYQCGIYLVRVQTEETIQTVKVVKR
jgi:hypothetical protein